METSNQAECGPGAAAKAVLNPGLDSTVTMHTNIQHKYYNIIIIIVVWHSSPLAYRDLQVATGWGTETELLITQISDCNTLRHCM